MPSETTSAAVYEYGIYLDDTLCLVRRATHAWHVRWHLRELLKEGWMRGE